MPRSRQQKATAALTPSDLTSEDAATIGFCKFSTETLKHLLDRCLHKDEKAWEALFSGMYGLVKDVVLRAGLKDENVEDAVGESFLKLVRSIEDVARAKNPLSYIGALARYTAIGFKRSDERTFLQKPPGPIRPDSNGLLASRDQGETPSQGVKIMATQVNEGLLEALDQLKPEEKQLIRLKYIEDLCYDEIAYIVGKETVTVRVATHRAVKKLKQLVQPAIREMVHDTAELWNHIAALKIPPEGSEKCDPQLIQLLEDYVADKASLDARRLREIESRLADSPALRERKVLLERRMLLDEDVRGYAPTATIPPRLLRRLMREVRTRAPHRACASR